MVKNLLKIQDELSKENTNLKLLAKAQKQAQTALNNIMLAVEQGVINKTTNAIMKELETQIEQLEEQILIEKNRNIIKLSENTIREYYIKALENEPLLLINTFIKDIVLFDDTIKITFNSPIRKSPNHQGQGFSLCKILNLNKLKMSYMYRLKFIPWCS